MAGVMAWRHRLGHKVVHVVPGPRSHTGREILLRRYHLNAAQLRVGDDGALALILPRALAGAPGEAGAGARALVLEGDTAARVLARLMVEVNRAGASRVAVAASLELLTSAGGPDAYLRRVTRTDRPRMDLMAVAGSGRCEASGGRPPRRGACR
jgi:hypothetical protein